MSLPLTPTTAERLTKLEAMAVTAQMQNRATLQSLQALAESVQALTEALAAHRSRVDGMDKVYRDMLLAKAVQLVIDYEGDEPTFEDYWEIDQSKTDLNLLYRVEEVTL
jgi:hypothetical protein